MTRALANTAAYLQRDKIGQIFSHRASVYLGSQGFLNYRSWTIISSIFYTGDVV
jgi:hypothetical protein